MRFTEHELTEAVTSAAKTVAAARHRGVRRRRDREDTWAALSRHERYLVLDAVGSQVLPVMLALPDVEVPVGTRPSFTDSQVLAAVQETLGDGASGLRGKVAVAARVALMRDALSKLPPRQE
jgi:hypothetical protein